ncbi:Protein of unknown function DUF3133 [Macleaya cordata]|uniref:Uncharacterized protein n=1 Tax=Macleaya cordata TaxID=56857 RepID=A0A200PUM6_MACCD|nr:Protein of unknown function DUF3133 [Macleaya cordata]
MAEATKLRLVRCPKCDNLLQELPNVPVYKCGGCGAVLQAKLKKQSVTTSNGSSEKSDEEGIRVSSEKLEGFAEKGGDFNLSETSETSDRDSNGVELKWREKLESFPEKEISASSNTENIVASTYVPRIVMEETGYGGKFRPSSKDPVDNQVDHDMNMNRNKQVEVNTEKENGEFKPQIGISSAYKRSEQLPDGQSRERDRSTAYRRTPRALVDDVGFSGSSYPEEEEAGEFKPQTGISNGYRRSEQFPDYQDRERDRAAYRSTPRAVVDDVSFSGSSYPDEGPSNYQPGSSYGNGGLSNNQNNLDGPDRVDFLEQDRAELLRKLDELKEQISRSCDVSEKAKERVPQVPYVGQNNWIPNSSSRSQQVFSQPFPVDEHIRKPPYINHGHEHVPMMHGHEMGMQNFYPAHVNASNDRRGHGDLFGPKMLGRAPTQPQREYPHRSSNGYFSGQIIDVDQEHISSYPHNNTFFHQAECPCSHCYNKGWQVPSQGLPMIFPNRRFSDGPANPMFYPLEEPRAFGPWSYNPRSANPPLNSHTQQSHTRRKNDHDSEIGGFGRSRVQRVPLVKRSGRRCLPIAGGAPFITCYNCFQLLPLPRKLLLMENNQQKLRCGACSTVISVLVENKKLVISVPTQTKEVSLEINDSSAQEVKDGFLHSHGHLNQGQMNYYSDDYDNSGYNFMSMDERLNSSESEKMQGLLTSSPSTFEDEGSPESVIARQDASSSAELPMKANVTPPLPGSPIHEHYEYADKLGSKFGKGNMSKRTDHEKIVLTRGISRQNSVKDAMVATEMDISFNEYSNTGMYQCSREAAKEENRPRNGKGGDSFLVGLIKKSFRDFSRSNQAEENDGPKVFINGQPIPERLVKKAEKQAGPIHPGEYWYDSRAGFWGVMGQPCLGIIPPFIEEFSYPLPKNCSSGDTGVFVNGRELHQKDLDLLACRGLPNARDKSYIVEISGRILDEDSGEELDSLGKLAPTTTFIRIIKVDIHTNQMSLAI